MNSWKFIQIQTDHLLFNFKDSISVKLLENFLCINQSLVFPEKRPRLKSVKITFKKYPAKNFTIQSLFTPDFLKTLSRIFQKLIDKFSHTNYITKHLSNKKKTSD